MEALIIQSCQPHTLPLDLQRLLFAYCGSVARAASCSVSARWYQCVLDVSMHLSATPELYTHVHACMVITDELARAIFADYHLTVRISCDELFDWTRQLCIVGNQSVCELFIKLGMTPTPRDVILSRNPWFRERLPVNLYEHRYDISELILYMLAHDYHDVMLDYFSGDRRWHFTLEYYSTSDKDKLISAVIASDNVAIVRWLVSYEYHNTNNKMMNEIITRDLITLAPAFYDIPGFIWRVCARGSVTMVTHIKTTHTAEKLLESAFDNDNLEIFNYLVEQGTSTNHLNFINGIKYGTLKCALRLKELHQIRINTRELIEAVATNHKIKLSMVMEHLPISQQDINHGMRICAKYGDASEDFLLRANNYDIDAYKKYGAVIITDTIDTTDTI